MTNREEPFFETLKNYATDGCFCKSPKGLEAAIPIVTNDTKVAKPVLFLKNSKTRNQEKNVSEF